jgi:hypothetical protein
MIAARVFDRLPDLQIIIGHMGEMIPFMLDRADEWVTLVAQCEGLASVAETFRWTGTMPGGGAELGTYRTDLALRANLSARCRVRHRPMATPECAAATVCAARVTGQKRAGKVMRPC